MNMSASIEKTIDIEKILKSKMGSKAKYVPGFLVSWLKKIIHEDEVNKFLWKVVVFPVRSGSPNACAI